jgi:hypothetical protein
MSYGTLAETSVFLTAESTEGTVVTPTSATDALEILEDGYAVNYSRESIETKTIDSNRESGETRIGIPNIEGSVSVYQKANTTAGGKPPAALLYKSLLGGERQSTGQITTKSSPANTSTVLQIEDADSAKLKVGDIVKVLTAGKHEVRPISAVSTGTGTATITFPFALENVPAASVKIEKCTTYFPSETSTSLSLVEYLADSIEAQVGGIKAVSASLKGWETGKIAQWDFKLQGLNYAKAVQSGTYTPNFSGLASTPVILSACAWLGSSKIAYNNFEVAIENTNSFIKSACASQGKIASRFTELKISGSINPYTELDDVDRFDLFDANTTTSLFLYCYNPASTDGEIKEVCALWFPTIKLTEIPTGDLDGVLVDQIKFMAQRTLGGDSVFMGFI